LRVSQSAEACRRKSHLVCAGRHDPVAILADAHALTGLLKVEILQQLHAVGELGVVLQTPKKMLARVLCILCEYAHRFRRRISHSGSGRASLPLMVYTGTAELEIFIVAADKGVARGLVKFETKSSQKSSELRLARARVICRVDPRC
jgi:hypothetical protein